MDVARSIDSEPRYLIALAKRARTLYTARWRRKPAGGFRLIQAPADELKIVQRSILKYFETIFRVHPAAKSGFSGARPIDHALPHVGRAVLSTADIEKCFDNVRAARVCRMLGNLGFDAEAARIVGGLVTLSGSLPQGAPTSSFLLNLVLFPLDERLTNCSRRHRLVYTRYADDLAFSGSYDFGNLLPIIANHVKQFGLKLSPTKTQLFLPEVEHVITKTIAVNERIALSQAFRERMNEDLEVARKIVQRERLGRRDYQFIVSALGRLAYARTISSGEARGFRERFFAVVPQTARLAATALMNRVRRNPVDSNQHLVGSHSVLGRRDSDRDTLRVIPGFVVATPSPSPLSNDRLASQ